MSSATIAIPPRNQAGSVEIVTGLTFEWLENGKICAYTLSNSTREVVEAYFNVNIQLMDEAEKDHPKDLFIILNDISHPNTSLTPLLRSRLNTIAERIRTGQVQYRSAVILRNSLFGNVFSLFGNSFSKTAKNTIQRFFVNRAEGIKWLKDFC